MTSRGLAVRVRLDLQHLIIFAMLGAIMFVSKQLLEFLPNVHMIGMLTMAYTLVYRKLALIPLSVFILLEGAYAGFALWWWPYLYLWPILWAVTMLLPQHTPRFLRGRLRGRWPKTLQVTMYILVCGLHGLLYGTLYAPYQILVFMNGNFSALFAWIAAGLPWDLIHAAGNLAMGTLIYPTARLLGKLERGVA